MRVQSNNYHATVQGAFCKAFDAQFKSERPYVGGATVFGEMADDAGRRITTSGHLSHDVKRYDDGLAILNLYSYRTLIGRMWRQPVGTGFRVFGWRTGLSYSVTTARHIGDLGNATVWGGITVRSADGQLDTPPGIEEINVAHDLMLQEMREGELLAPVGPRLLSFIANDTPDRVIRIAGTREGFGPQEAAVPVMAMDGELLAAAHYPGMLTGSQRPRLVVRQTPRKGYFVNAREKVCGTYEVLP